MPSHAEIMNAYQLLDREYKYSVADAHFWLKWAQSRSPAFDWTYYLACNGLSMLGCLDSYEEAKVVLQRFIDTGQLVHDAVDDSEMIANSVLDWIQNELTRKMEEFAWDGEVGTHMVTYSSEQGGRVVRVPSDPREGVVPVYRL